MPTAETLETHKLNQMKKAGHRTPISKREWLEDETGISLDISLLTFDNIHELIDEEIPDNYPETWRIIGDLIESPCFVGEHAYKIIDRTKDGSQSIWQLAHSLRENLFLLKTPSKNRLIEKAPRDYDKVYILANALENLPKAPISNKDAVSLIYITPNEYRYIDRLTKSILNNPKAKTAKNLGLLLSKAPRDFDQAPEFIEFLVENHREILNKDNVNALIRIIPDECNETLKIAKSLEDIADAAQIGSILRKTPKESKQVIKLLGFIEETPYDTVDNKRILVTKLPKDYREDRLVEAAQDVLSRGQGSLYFWMTS